MKEDTYVYKVVDEEIETNGIRVFSLDAEQELNNFLRNEKVPGKAYLYKMRIPKDTNFIAFTNIIFFDNKNMTLPVGMDLSKKVLIDLSNIQLEQIKSKELNILQFEDEEDNFSKKYIKTIEVKEME